ncbi:MAG: hypothetical protein MJ248_05975, partial [Bacilli bacterium]|nr:hypothetical protein [Bacilli bacterium]
PWIISEDGQSMRPSNSRHANTFSIIYTSVTLGPDQVFAFDYLADTEYGCDVLYILIDRKIVQQISGQSPDWETCYCYVPLEQGTHEVAFAYFKDNAANAGKDTVYVKNLRVISTDRIDKPSLFYHDAYYGYSAELNTYLHYVDVVLNEDDGYYHVNSKEGPYLLANVQNSSGFSNTSILEYTGVGDPNNIDASWRNALKGYSTLILQYASYQNNSEVGLVPVTEELHLALVNIMKTISNNGENEWLEVCGFLSAYARDNITDPIKGLAPFSAYEGQLGENYVNFNRLIMPRGLYTRFIPETSGVYTFYSITDTNYETICWLYDEDLNLMAESDFGERYYMMVEKPDPNCAVYGYLEAGKPYYISMAYANLNVFGDLPFVIEFLDATEYTIFTLASPNIYTTLLDENGEMTQNVIAGGIDVALGDDGYYHHLKEDGSLGSILYCDFEYGTGLFDSQGTVLSIKDMILYGAFDLYFRDDDGNLIKHVDRTEDIRPYISQMITEGDAKGTVMVTEELAEILQEMMDCYIFNGVEHQWTKLCYYFKTISK